MLAGAHNVPATVRPVFSPEGACWRLEFQIPGVCTGTGDESFTSRESALERASEIAATDSRLTVVLGSR